MHARGWPGRFRTLRAWQILTGFCAVVLATVPLALGGGVAYASLGTNDYPSYLATAPKDSLADPWGFLNRECTSFVAWRLNHDNGVAFSNNMVGPNGIRGHFGNASNWANNAIKIGYTVNSIPAPGSVAVWPTSVGHVGYVDTVNADGTINTEEYNWNLDGAYHTRTKFNWSAKGVKFIHIRDLSSSAVAVLPTSDGHIQVFSDANGTLRENWYDPVNGQIGGWSSVGGMTVQGAPALVARAGQQVIDAFTRNSAGQIVETWYNWGTGQWGGWITVNGGTFSSDPSAVATSDGHDQVFATSSSGTLAMNWFNPVNGHIGGGSSVGGMTVQGTPALVARAGQQVIDAFTRNSAGQIVETWYNWGTGQWGGWITISGATFTSSPAAVATSDGHDQVFASNSGTIEQNWFDLITGNIGNWRII